MAKGYVEDHDGVYMALTDEVQAVGGSTRQELYDRKISWWFEDEKNLKDDLEWH